MNRGDLMPITSPGMGKYQTDDDPEDIKGSQSKDYKSGYWKGGLEPPKSFKPMLQVDIKSGKVLLDRMGKNERG